MCVSPAPRWWHCTPAEQGEHRGAGGSETVPHIQPPQHRAQVLLSPGTGEISLPTVEKGAGSDPQEVTNVGKTAPVSSRGPGWGPMLSAIPTCSARAGHSGPTGSRGSQAPVSPPTQRVREGMTPLGLASPPSAPPSPSCLGLVATNGFHLLRPPAPDATFVPETDQTEAHEDPPRQPAPQPSLPKSPPISLLLSVRPRGSEEAPAQPGPLNTGQGLGSPEEPLLLWLRVTVALGLGRKTSLSVRVACKSVCCWSDMPSGMCLETVQGAPAGAARWVGRLPATHKVAGVIPG